MSERRNEKRLEVCLDALWDGKSGNYSARITDLSEGGCYIDTLGEAQVGEVLNLKLQVQNGEWLELTGEVAHEMPPLGFGIRFLELPAEQLERLRSAPAGLQSSGADVSAILSR
jgi:Tfp pilus assembly protein PilZ